MELKSILEALLFASQKPMTPRDLAELLATAAADPADSTVFAHKKTPVEEIDRALDGLAAEYEAQQRVFRPVCIAGAWQFASRPEYGPWLKALVGERNRPARLSPASLETLTIIAYRQPLTRAEIEQIRGVSVDGVMQTLLERGLIEPAGRAEAAGRPMTFGTTALFLEAFGLRSLEELPAADELRRLEVNKPESLLTADPELATAPGETLPLPNLETAGKPEESPANGSHPAPPTGPAT